MYCEQVVQACFLGWNVEDLAAGAQEPPPVHDDEPSERGGNERLGEQRDGAATLQLGARVLKQLAVSQIEHQHIAPRSHQVHVIARDSELDV